MADAPFALSEPLLVLHQAGISSLLRIDVPRPTLTEPWAALANSMQPGVALAWTYPELARDMAAKDRPDRSRAFKRLIDALSLPRGSIAFLPCCAASAPNDSAHTDFFQVLRIVRPGAVVFFGMEDSAALRSLRAQTIPGVSIATAPGPDELSSLADPDFTQLVHRLRTVAQDLRGAANP